MSDDRFKVSGKTVRVTYWSLDEYADAANANGSDHLKARFDRDDDWAGHTSYSDAQALARSGWGDMLAETLDIAENAVSTCEQTHEVMRPVSPVFDVQGDCVELGRYLAGDPECMVDYPLQPTSTVGRVITLCASFAISASIDSDVINRRGQVIVALALALSRLGHSVELWSDHSIESGHGREKKTLRERVLVKSANDTLDPARIMFAYAHPAMLRQIGFAAANGNPLGFYSGIPIAPEENLPEGTIYLPELCSGRNVPDAHLELRKHLGNLGLLAE